MDGKYRFSPLAQVQLDAIWDYSYRRFGLPQADNYLDGLFNAVKEITKTGRYLGLPPKQVPPDRLAGITTVSVHYVHYEKHFLYLRRLSDNVLGVVCILGDRMDTPKRLKEQLANPLTNV